jgi:hypothetical protein
VRRGVYRCALRALLRGLRSEQFRRALAEGGAAAALKVRMLRVLCSSIQHICGDCAGQGCAMQPTGLCGQSAHAPQQCAVPMLQEFLGTSDAAADEQLRNMAQAALEALE